jgi:hypothetical protein
VSDVPGRSTVFSSLHAIPTIIPIALAICAGLLGYGHLQQRVDDQQLQLTEIKVQAAADRDNIGKRLDSLTEAFRDSQRQQDGRMAKIESSVEVIRTILQRDVSPQR